ncbi:hypothetical protein EGU77_08695 [Pseudomonas syringae pv. theae]|nr:hypothetical protein [Pseudomonas syringae pv. theae]MBL3836837.1 hypothetical protein [Pseudomonas syringae pv. theae]MBL3866837.1 hypothetical protein [Pseudomonas syringae pv. theae]
MEGEHMIHEVIVEGFVLQVDVTHCENNPPQPNNRDSDWDCLGTRELEYQLLSGITYDSAGIRMDCSGWDLREASRLHDAQIRTALWREIDSSLFRQRWAA